MAARQRHFDFCGQEEITDHVKAICAKRSSQGILVTNSEDSMTRISKFVFAASFATLAIFSPASAGSFTDAQKAEMEEIIRGYLLKNPEMLRDMAEKLEQKDKLAEEELRGKALVSFKDQVFKTSTDPFIGNAKGDVVVVEFMDYNCGWCKKSMSEVSTLLKSDPKVKFVFKELPIFGEHSEFAARAALAAAKQGKYWELHQAMFSHEGQVTTDVVKQLAEAQGLDIKKLQVDIESKEIGEQIAANLQLGKDLAINGTPAFIIDDQVHGGYLPLDGMTAAIADVRTKGCKYC
jgi:protein-disulfide isomerase